MPALLPRVDAEVAVACVLVVITVAAMLTVQSVEEALMRLEVEAEREATGGKKIAITAHGWMG